MAKEKSYSRKEIKELVAISKKIKARQPVLPSEVQKIVDFKYEEKKTKFGNILTKMALPGSIILGMTMAAFPQFYVNLVAKLPPWTNMTPNLLNAVDYVWSIIGKPVKQANIIYHIPNVILYSFGVVGVKKLFDFVRRKTWLNVVENARNEIEKRIERGDLNYDLNPHHSVLFIGKGDYIGEQFYYDEDKNDVITLASQKPNYSDHWIKYEISASFNLLDRTLKLADAGDCGEYVFFPVKDSELFLPGEKEYDISPEKVEVLIRNIRDVEKENNWEPKRIVIVGDRKQFTPVRTETKTGILEHTKENISLESIDREIRKVTIIDASDLVMKEILKRFPGKKVLFRSSEDGSTNYKKRFYDRLDEFGYDEEKSYTESVIIGYDLHEEQIHRESLKSKLQEYMPVVLSSDVRDALLRNGFAQDQFIYVPDIVLRSLEEIAAAN